MQYMICNRRAGVDKRSDRKRKQGGELEFHSGPHSRIQITMRSERGAKCVFVSKHCLAQELRNSQ